MAIFLKAHGTISFNSDGVPIIAGTRVKVRMIAIDHTIHGWDPQEIHRQYPTLTLAQIHSALAYYYDYKVAIDAEIARDLEQVDRLMEEIESLQDSSQLRAKLKARRP